MLIFNKKIENILFFINKIILNIVEKFKYNIN